MSEFSKTAKEVNELATSLVELRQEATAYHPSLKSKVLPFVFAACRLMNDSFQTT